MNSLDKFLGKSKVFTIGGEEVEIFPLMIKDLDVVTELGSTSDTIRTEALRKLMKKSLKKSFPDATDEQMENFDIRFLGEYLTAIFEVSGLKVDTKKLQEMMDSSSKG